MNWDNEQFRGKLRINREAFYFILSMVYPCIVKTPPDFVPDPIEPERQFALMIYGLAHGVLC